MKYQKCYVAPTPNNSPTTETSEDAILFSFLNQLQIPTSPTPEQLLNSHIASFRQQQIYMMHLPAPPQILPRQTIHLRTNLRVANNLLSQDITLQRPLAISQLNSRGLNKVKWDFIVNRVLSDNLDIIVLTEAKGYDPHWSNSITKLNLSVVYSTCDYRGGVLIIYRTDLIQLTILQSHPGTFICADVIFHNSERVQQFVLVATYINPHPDPREIQGISKWKLLCTNYIQDSTTPLLIVGDLNAKGIFHHRQHWAPLGVVNLLADQITYHRGVGQNLISSSLDAILTRNLSVDNIKLSWDTNSDHALISCNMSHIIAQRSELRYTKQKTDQAWDSIDNLRLILDSGFPFISAEHSLIKLLGPKSKIKFSMHSSDLPDDCTFAEFKAHLQEKKLGYQNELNAELDKVDYSNNSEGYHEIMHKLIRGHQNRTGIGLSTMISTAKENGQVQSTAKSKGIFANMFNAKFNSHPGNQLVNPIPIDTTSVDFKIQRLSQDTDPVEFERLLDLQHQCDKDPNNFWQKLRLQVLNSLQQSSCNDLRLAIIDSFKCFSTKKSHGDDLVSLICRSKSLPLLDQCTCPSHSKHLRSVADCTKFLYGASIKTIERPCQLCHHQIEDTTDVVNVSEIIAERLALIITTSNTPHYLYSCRIAMLSKTNSIIADKVNDIRPIGILSVLWKVIERALKSLFDLHAPDFLNVGPEQAGFAAGRSTSEHIAMVINRLSNQRFIYKGPNHEAWLARTKQRLHVFIDLTAAFDSVNHKLLMKILRTRLHDTWKGPTMLRDLCLKQLESQYTFMTMNVSDFMIKVTNGCTQGSVLSPNLFNIYFDALTTEDIHLKDIKLRTRHLLDQYLHQHGNINKWTETILIKFADDLYLEFEDKSAFLRWDKYRRPIWAKYCMEINTNKSVILTKWHDPMRLVISSTSQDKLDALYLSLPDPYLTEQATALQSSNFSNNRPSAVLHFRDEASVTRTKRLVTRNECTWKRFEPKYIESFQHTVWPIKPSVKYLGITMNLGMKSTSTSKTQQELIQDKIIKILGITTGQRFRMQYKTEQVYIHCLLRYYLDPLIATGILSIDKGLRICQRIQYKLVKPPWGVSHNAITQIVPQVDWLKVWYDSAMRIQKLIPMYTVDKLRSDIVSSLLNPHDYTRPISDPNARIASLQIEVGPINYASQIPSSCYKPEFTCPTCLKQTLLPVDYFSASHLPIVFTDGSQHTDIFNQPSVGIGIFSAYFDIYVSRSLNWKHGNADAAYRANNAVYLTNNTAEIIAIHEAITLIIAQPPAKFSPVVTILTDSLYALNLIVQHQRLSPNYVHANLVQRIHLLSHRAKLLGITIIVQKVQAHSLSLDLSATGNHAADFLANLASTGHLLVPRVHPTLPALHDSHPISLCSPCQRTWSQMSLTQRQDKKYLLVQNERVGAGPKQAISATIQFQAPAVPDHPFLVWGNKMTKNQAQTLKREAIKQSIKQIRQTRQTSGQTTNLNYLIIIQDFLKDTEHSDLSEAKLEEIIQVMTLPTQHIPADQVQLKTYLCSRIPKSRPGTVLEENLEMFASHIAILKKKGLWDKMPNSTVPSVRWQEIVSPSQALTIASLFHSKPPHVAIDKMYQWRLNKTPASLLQDYLRRVPESLTMLGAASGFLRSGGMLQCMSCQAKHRTPEQCRASIRHLRQCLWSRYDTVNPPPTVHHTTVTRLDNHLAPPDVIELWRLSVIHRTISKGYLRMSSIASMAVIVNWAADYRAWLRDHAGFLICEVDPPPKDHRHLEQPESPLDSPDHWSPTDFNLEDEQSNIGKRELPNALDLSFADLHSSSKRSRIQPPLPPPAPPRTPAFRSQAIATALAAPPQLHTDTENSAFAELLLSTTHTMDWERPSNRLRQKLHSIQSDLFSSQEIEMIDTMTRKIPTQLQIVSPYHSEISMEVRSLEAKLPLIRPVTREVPLVHYYTTTITESYFITVAQVTTAACYKKLLKEHYWSQADSYWNPTEYLQTTSPVREQIVRCISDSTSTGQPDLKRSYSPSNQYMTQGSHSSYPAKRRRLDEDPT